MVCLILVKLQIVSLPYVKEDTGGGKERDQGRERVCEYHLQMIHFTYKKFGMIRFMSGIIVKTHIVTFYYILYYNNNIVHHCLDSSMHTIIYNVNNIGHVTVK